MYWKVNTCVHFDVTSNAYRLCFLVSILKLAKNGTRVGFFFTKTGHLAKDDISIGIIRCISIIKFSLLLLIKII